MASSARQSPIRPVLPIKLEMPNSFLVIYVRTHKVMSTENKMKGIDDGHCVFLIKNHNTD